MNADCTLRQERTDGVRMHPTVDSARRGARLGPPRRRQHIAGRRRVRQAAHSQGRPASDAQRDPRHANHGIR